MSESSPEAPQGKNSSGAELLKLLAILVGSVVGAWLLVKVFSEFI